MVIMNIAGENAAKTGILSHSPGIMTPKSPITGGPDGRVAMTVKPRPKKSNNALCAGGRIIIISAPK